MSGEMADPTSAPAGGPMTLRFLGTGTATPSLRRLSSSYLLSTASGNTILIDIGPSVVRRLLEFGFTVDEIDMVVLTHFHPDHTADLATFLFASNYGELERKKDLVLLGGRGLDTFYRRLVRLYPSIRPKGYALTLKTMARDTWTPWPDVTIETVPMKHRRESIGIKVKSAKTVAFTGDTDVSRNLVVLAKGVDLLVSECSFPETKIEGHLDLAALRQVVEKAKPHQVMLSHLYPDWEGFRGSLHAPLLLAEDGLEITL